ncbi:CPBP family intramembrane metalloprotease [Dietzia sp. CQ4]|uniref:CPBP family intramembrane glutamic endopeptidase n=1 Tax=Dietzia TaxID=37914 RepID=UPI0015F8051C|nr:CPBP family intramembrane glutamic endopeptidase [Dietzia sp. CQ4]MBB1033761.1 CPBP family intramembrane metalloprotease [Dietzia sp. CQ4]
MTEFVLFCAPTLIYVVVQSRRGDRSAGAAMRLAGVSRGSLAAMSSVGVAAAVVLRAVGEEVFFRGLLGGVFIRRLGFGWGNLLQSVVFLVPHLALLAVDVRLWPLIPVQFAAGWLLGWLRHRSGTLVPGAAVHALANLAAGAIAAGLLPV